jgi:hypothetical protein
VAWVREFDPQEPQRAHGMGVQFLKVAPGSRPMLERLLAFKAQPARTPSSGVPTRVASSEGSGPRPKAAAGSTPNQPDLLEGDVSTWIDDAGMRAAADRARVLASRVEDVEALRVREREEPPTIEHALADLPRLLGMRRPAG